MTIIDTTIRRFRVDIADADLDDLRVRLSRTRWPDEAPGDGWSDGVPLSYLNELVMYWASTYDWRAHEAQLNQFSQFTTTIDSATVHFIHVQSPESHALPLLMTNGWPSSIVDFIKVIAPLTDPRSYGGDPADAFHVVAPSIPGFAFSRARGTGWNLDRVTRAFAALMERLGYARYGAHGGDFGSLVSPELGRLHPDRVVGIHLTGVLSPPPTDPVDLAALTEAEQARLDDLKRFQRWRRWYAMIQATRPQTLAYALTDSPVAQLAWMVDVFKEYTDSTAVPEDAVDRDQLLTNVSLYWLTRTAGSSARLFKETPATYARQPSHPPCRPASRCSRANHPCPSAPSPSAATTSCTGQNSTAGATSRPWRYPTW